MKSAHSFAREQRPADKSIYRFTANRGISNPLRPRTRPTVKKQKIVQPDVTEGEWYSTGTAVVNESGETIAAAAFKIHTDLPKRRRDMRMLANAKKLDALARTFLNTYPSGSDDVLIAQLLEMAKEAIGGTHG